MIIYLSDTWDLHRMDYSRGRCTRLFQHQRLGVSFDYAVISAWSLQLRSQPPATVRVLLGEMVEPVKNWCASMRTWVHIPSPKAWGYPIRFQAQKWAFLSKKFGAELLRKDTQWWPLAFTYTQTHIHMCAHLQTHTIFKKIVLNQNMTLTSNGMIYW